MWFLCVAELARQNLYNTFTLSTATHTHMPSARLTNTDTSPILISLFEHEYTFGQFSILLIMSYACARLQEVAVDLDWSLQPFATPLYKEL